MTVVVTHSTPADGSFSTTGATAWNANHTLSGVGTMAGQDANSVAITGGSISGVSGVVTSVGGTGTVNGLSLSGTVTSSGNLTFGGTLDLSSPPAIGSTAANTGAFTTLSASSTVSGTGFSTYLASPPAIGSTTASTGRFTTVTSTVATGTAPFTVASTTAVANLSIGGNAGTVTNGVYTTDTGTVTNTMLAGSIANAKLTNSSITFGSTAQALGSTVSAISGVTIDNGAIGGTTAAAGTFTTLIGGSGSANYEQITGGATGKAVQFQSLGSDAAVSLAIQSKGTGAIDLAAGSSGVNISNGGTVTAVTGISGGSYSSIPTVTISPPTTAGGVQATATAAMQFVSTSTIAAAGTGYNVGDTITLTGGTFSSATQITVATLTGGAGTGVATFTVLGAGTYTALPSNPVSTTVSPSGGTGFQLTAVWTVRAGNYTITNAGSGYVEQPTITFSSGTATAYATVGAEPTIKSLFGGATTSGLAVATSGGTQVKFVDVGDGNRPLHIFGGSTSNAQTGGIFQPISGANIAYSTNTGIHNFYTAGRSSTLQFSVSHTASAVNYVQITGAATGGNPTISSQGSDGGIPLVLQAKASIIRFLTGNGAENFRVNTVSSTANYLAVSGAAASSSPSLNAQGADADIDLTLTPKGAGNVKFGTYTVSALLAVAGYITIKDSGGTTRRLLVG